MVSFVTSYWLDSGTYLLDDIKYLLFEHLAQYLIVNHKPLLPAILDLAAVFFNTSSIKLDFSLSTYLL